MCIFNLKTAISHVRFPLMCRVCAILIIKLSLTSNLIGQEKEGSFFWQVYPNYTFTQISKNSAEINAKITSLPFIGLGLGYNRKISKKIHADISLNIHGVSSRFQSIPINNIEKTYVPMISGNLYFPTRPNPKGHFLFLSLGGNLSYNFDSKTEFIITDTINNRKITLTTEREDLFNLFGNIGFGVYFKKPKRDISLSLQFSHGFRNTYKAGILLLENQKETFAEIISNDSYLSLHCKFFFKKRQLNSK